MVVTIEITVFWYVTLCTLVECYHNFRGTFCLHLYDRKVSQARKKSYGYRERGKQGTILSKSKEDSMKRLGFERVVFQGQCD
jgi:hypothetical protein